MTPPKRRQVPAWPRGEQRPDRDPDRRRPAPPHPGFAAFPLDIDADVCRLCRALVPATELARSRHQEWDQQIMQLSGAGLRTAPSVETAADASPVPATSPPTPEQEEAAGLARPGVGGSNHQHNRPAARERHSPDGTPPPDPAPPPRGRSGGPKRGRPMRSVDEIEEADRREYEQRHAAEGRR